MELTKDLTEEHKLIKRMIDILENAANNLENGKEINHAIFENAVNFIRNFADKFHHAKEEDILFKEMIKKGMPEKDSPIEAMLIEHEQGRNFVKDMIEGINAERKNGKKKIIGGAKGYIELLREHIDKEDNILYPIAERMFTDDEKKSQFKEYKKAETKKGGNSTVRKYKFMVTSLEK